MQQPKRIQPGTRRHPRPYGRARRGTILIWLALLVPVMFGVAAVVLDVGLAQYTQKQMLNAADAGAVDGLRHMDDIPPTWRPTGKYHDAITAAIDTATGNGCYTGPVPLPSYDQTRTLAAWNDWKECARRYAAQQTVGSVFDDDFDLDGADDDITTPADNDALALGAGPIVPLSGGVTDVNAKELLDTTDLGTEAGMFNPFLEFNTTDAVHGDMLAGSYSADESHLEMDDYTRSDFPAPGVATNDNAFMVRLRRTPEVAALSPLDRVAGISSAGPALPLLMGRASMVRGGDPTAGYSIRHHGLTVRGASIAAGEPAITAGPRLPNNITGLMAAPNERFGSIEGLLPLAILRDRPGAITDDWAGLANYPAFTLFTMGANGTSTNSTLQYTRVASVAFPLTAVSIIIIVNDSTGFETLPRPFRALIMAGGGEDAEIIQVDAVVGTTWVVTRGLSPTPAVAHGVSRTIVSLEPESIGGSIPFGVAPFTDNADLPTASPITDPADISIFVPGFGFPPFFHGGDFGYIRILDFTTDGPPGFGIRPRTITFGRVLFVVDSTDNTRIALAKFPGAIGLNVSSTLTQPLTGLTDDTIDNPFFGIFARRSLAAFDAVQAPALHRTNSN